MNTKIYLYLYNGKLYVSQKPLRTDNHKKHTNDERLEIKTRKLLRKFEIYYNCERMHKGLNYLTPMDYYKSLRKK